jgi:nicotinate-nucleotide--dimethylbenzimidazole phosphoribosyltransferase
VRASDFGGSWITISVKGRLISVLINRDSFYMNGLQKNAKVIDATSMAAARQHQGILTKPSGSLGRLEIIAEQFAGWQSSPHPVLDSVKVVVFAGDHGVCQQQVSAFPQAVTTQMVVNFLEGGAAISVLSNSIGADLVVCNMGTVTPLPAAYLTHPRLVQRQIAAGTADFSQQAAMTEEQVKAALAAGKAMAESVDSQLFIGGEMGIGNTTSASAIYAALLSLSPEAVVGSGTGIDAAGIQRKQSVIATALSLHKGNLNDPYQVLRCVGGLEIAALVGSYITCAQRGVPVLVDGFICTAAALVAVRINPSVQQWLLFSHQSAEFAHASALESLGVEPLLNLGLRLGEGSGAALAVPMLRSALDLHNQMATFVQAGVSSSD